jgi:hypothetical protein
MQRRWDMHAVVHEKNGSYIVKQLTTGVGDSGIIFTGTQEECVARLKKILEGDKEYYLVSRVSKEWETEREIFTAPRGSNLCFPEAILVKYYLDREEAEDVLKVLEYIEKSLRTGGHV